jgi:hypothetical protein
MNSLVFALVTTASLASASTRTNAEETTSPAAEHRMLLAQGDPMPPPAAQPGPSSTEPQVAMAPVAPPSGAAPSGNDLSIWGVFPYNYGGFGYGIGGRFAMPLPIPSLLPKTSRIRDNWSIEFGADYVRFSLGYANSDYAVNWLLPVAGVRWNVWLSDNFAVYPKVEAGYEIAWISGFPSGYSSPSYGGVYVSGAAGLVYRLGNSLALRAEAGSFGLKGGIGLKF